MADTTEVDLEQEVLRYQMEESRDALAQKIEKLEEKVTESVQSATATVAEATATVMETVQNATASVTDTVDSVTNAVQGTVESVRSSVEGTVDSVKDAFDLSLQVKQHPWLMWGGAIAVGYFAERLLPAPSNRSSAGSIRPQKAISFSNQITPAASDWNPPSPAAMPESPLNGGHSNGTANSAVASASSGWLDRMGEAFGPEISKLQNLAVGVVLGSVRDMILEASPQPLKQPLAEVIDGFTEKLGGQCIQGSMTASDGRTNRSY